jgi:hypothetical protein
MPPCIFVVWTQEGGPLLPLAEGQSKDGRFRKAFATQCLGRDANVRGQGFATTSTISAGHNDSPATPLSLC